MLGLYQASRLYQAMKILQHLIKLDNFNVFLAAASNFCKICQICFKRTQAKVIWSRQDQPRLGIVQHASFRLRLIWFHWIMPRSDGASFRH